MKKIILTVLFSSIFILGGCFGSTNDDLVGDSEAKMEIQKSKFEEIVNLMARNESKRADIEGVLNGVYIYNSTGEELEYYTVTYLLELNEDQVVDVLSKMYNAYDANQVSAFVLSGKALGYSGLGNFTGAESFNIPVEDLIQLSDVVLNLETGKKHYANGEEMNVTDPKILLSETTVEEYKEFEVILTASNIESNLIEAVDLLINYDSNYIELTSDPVTFSGDLMPGLEMITDSEDGKVGVAVTNTSGMTLDGEIMRFKFKALKDGDTSISIGKADFIDTSLEKIILDYSDQGTVSIDPGVTPSSSVSLSDVSGNEGSQGVIEVGLNEVSDPISGVEVNLAYDSAYISAEEAGINFVGNLSGAHKIVNIENGVIKIAATLSDSAILEGKIMEVSLGLLAEGTTNVTIDSVKVIKDDLSEISAIDISDTSTVTILKAEDLSLESLSISPTSTQVSLDGSYTLPSTGVATMSDLSTKTVDVIWNPSTVDTSTEGTFDYTASYTENGITKTATMSVEIITEEPLGEYYATNPNGQFGTEKTISSFSDWSTDMIIAQGAANDDPRAFRGYHEKATDFYALFAAYDDTNLYLMVEMPSIDGRDIISKDWQYALDENLGMGVAINTGKGVVGDGEMDTGITVWNDAKYYSIQRGIDTLLMFHPQEYGTPGFFITNAEGKLSYEEEYCLTFTGKGITTSAEIGLVSNTMYGRPDNGGLTKDEYLAKNDYVDFFTDKSDISGYMYQITIPLEGLGIDKAYLQSNGIGVMTFSTFGTSIMDALPWDSTLIDVATEEYSADSSSSAEKEDVDIITAPLARIGK